MRKCIRTFGVYRTRVLETQQRRRAEIAISDSGLGTRGSYLKGTNEEAKIGIEKGARPLEVVVSLDDVTDITPSLADEAFAKLAKTIGFPSFEERVQIAGARNWRKDWSDSC